MGECCKKINPQNKETTVVQWLDLANYKIVEHYTEYNCETCGRRVIMKFDL